MKIVYHEKFLESYDTDPAAAAGRIDCIVDELTGSYDFIEPQPASIEDILLVHQKEHLERVQRKGFLYEMALLAAGGAIRAAEICLSGEPAFALIRPPGHHASPNSCWGFCWFNNVAVAVEKLRAGGTVKKALIIDIDLHYGDGTANIYRGTTEVTYHHMDSLNTLAEFLKASRDIDLVAVSAGFDRHLEDWGGTLSTEDYFTIGKTIDEFARTTCGRKVFTVLEGGYNHKVLGKNVKALLDGFEAR